MSATYLFRLAPLGPFHFGGRGVGVEETEGFCPADTLFSALCLTQREWAPRAGPAGEPWPEAFLPGDGRPAPPLRLSSAFPYAGDVLFFPKPRLPAPLPPAGAPERAKRLKRISTVSEGIFRAWLRRGDLGGELRPEHLLHDGRVWVTGAELDRLRGQWPGLDPGFRLWDNQDVPRVSVDRATSRSSVYQAGVMRFREGAGLFFLADFVGTDPAAAAERARLEALLAVLGDGGLGGERSSGYGQFRPHPAAPLAGWGLEGAGLFVTLAPYHPTPPEVQAGVLGEGASYSLVARRGWVANAALRRRVVRMLAEGSALCHTGRAGYGDLVDVTPLDEQGAPAGAHPVWRYGIAYPVPALAPAGGEEGAS